MNIRTLENAERLAGALTRHTGEETLKQLASLLHYNSKQLERDIEALFAVINEIDMKGK